MALFSLAICEAVSLFISVIQFIVKPGIFKNAFTANDAKPPAPITAMRKASPQPLSEGEGTDLLVESLFIF
jgi:hypothetical protein